MNWGMNWGQTYTFDSLTVLILSFYLLKMREELGNVNCVGLTLRNG
jgi:hypothetical protein